MRASAPFAGLALAVAVLAAGPLGAEEPGAPGRTETVEYRDGDVVLEGFLAWPDEARVPPKASAPGVLVVHEWWGLAPHAKRKAEALARLGYVAFALDMYGKGKLTSDPKQAGEWAGQFRGDDAKREKGRKRAAAGLAVLAKASQVDGTRLAAVGFCFGGTVALELAWSGADLDAVVCFHGQPTAPRAEEAKGVKASVLVCHGADDPMVPQEALRAFEKAMKEAKADWSLVQYGGAVHAFTNPDAAKAGLPGVAYDEKADRRSWEHMRALLAERLGR